MEIEITVIFERMLLAVLAGGLIGLERSFHGRAAGFRTHTLVCVASTMLILVSEMYVAGLREGVTSDPLRTIQGIVTGIGFLGAGVILKEGANIRGLTTAASIWMTAAIGIVIGGGHHTLAFLAAAITIVALIGFRWIEHVFPTHEFGNLTVRIPRAAGFKEDDLTALIAQFGARAQSAGYHLEKAGEIIVCEMAVHTRRRGDF
jgi:putative Mg2+ transporter-C (MgtC) family protein